MKHIFRFSSKNSKHQCNLASINFVICIGYMQLEVVIVKDTELHETKNCLRQRGKHIEVQGIALGRERCKEQKTVKKTQKDISEQKKNWTNETKERKNVIFINSYKYFKELKDNQITAFNEFSRTQNNLSI